MQETVSRWELLVGRCFDVGQVAGRGGTGNGLSDGYMLV